MFNHFAVLEHQYKSNFEAHLKKGYMATRFKKINPIPCAIVFVLKSDVTVYLHLQVFGYKLNYNNRFQLIILLSVERCK